MNGPLPPISDHPSDPVPLKSNKLLLLKSNCCLPLNVFASHNKCSKCWPKAQCLENSFWKGWMKEYLPALQIRKKWTSQCHNFTVGDLVLITDEKLLSGHWPMGLIEELFPDSNGHVHHVKVRTTATGYRGDIRKLCLVKGVQNL